MKLTPTPSRRAFNSQPLRPENTVIIAKRKPPATSWWADAKTREEFRAAADARAKEIAAVHGPVPDYGGDA